ncbi:hypothetical protein LR48_Vigan181s002000 [Vigna angularis]|uniref:Uncharacterized protein n=2 Tax=Phaseolus angularis TaxID=3914 RepID=A0A0L9T582_PHAAN|nr:hypothetical protein LR48_Vigan181s002000 [Vigna angularis]BAT98116.1 hypothetical protein VIGAN_09174000 [Vigna angularis var. angularis]
MWNQEKGLKGSPGSVNGDQDSVNRGKIGRREEFLQDVLKGKKEAKISMEAGQDSLLDIKKAKKPSYGGESSTNSEKKRETEASVLSVDGFATIRGQERREENICGEEGNDENCDGDIDVTAAEKVAKVVFTAAEKVAKTVVFTAAEKVEKVVVFTAAEKIAKDVVFTAAQEVAKAVLSRGDSGVGFGVYVKTVKKGEDRGKKAEYGGNRVTMMAGNKVEDAAVLSGEKFIQEFKIWLSQTYKTAEDQWQRYFFAGLQYNIQRKQLLQHDDEDEIGWSDQQVLSFLASRMNKFGQGEGFASTAAIKIQKRFWGWKNRKEFLIIHQKRVKIQAHVSGHQVRRQYRTIIGSMGILEKKQLLKESTIFSYRPPPKPPDLNWRQQPVGSLPMMISHGNKHYCTNLEDKVVLKQGVMIGYNMIGYNG